MAKEPTPSDQAGKEAITEEQQPQKKGKLAGILPMVLGVAVMAGLAWGFTQFVLVETIEKSLKGVLVESSGEGGTEETTANEGEPTEDGGQASDGSADHSKAGKAMPRVAMDMEDLQRRTKTNLLRVHIKSKVPW